MTPIWGRYGPFFLYGYSVLLIAGALLALAVTAIQARRLRPVEDASRAAPAWLDGALAAAAAAIIGGRAVFVWLNVAYFTENPVEAWQPWRGGLNYHGALLAGLAALGLWAFLTRRPFLPYAGLLAPGLALLVAFGWAACLADGCAYGRATLPGLLAADLPDDSGVLAVRYRTQLAGAVGAVVIFAVAWWASRRVRLARLFWGTLAGLALVHAFVALGRDDPSPVVRGFRLDLLMELGLLVVSVAGCVWAGKRTASTVPQTTVDR